MMHFSHENMKKPLKVTSNNNFHYWPNWPNGPKQKSRTTKSPLMQDWVFRLGCQYYMQKEKLVRNIKDYFQNSNKKKCYVTQKCRLEV